MKTKLLLVSLAVFVAIVVIYLSVAVYHVPGEERSFKGNMYQLRMCLEDFSRRTGGYYPADINTRVAQVLRELGVSSDDESSIAGAGTVDSVRARDIGSTGPALLPEGCGNVCDPSYRSRAIQRRFDRSSRARPALVTSHVDPPEWKPQSAGIVFYVPLGVQGAAATGYKLFAADKHGLIDVVLSSEK
jgi:hypothetical protein